MAKKLITLEDELKDIKSGQNKSKAATKKAESMGEAVKTIQVEEQYKNTEKKKVEVDKPDKGLANFKKPLFKCDECGAKFKKEVTLNKHFNTKHEMQNCKVCHVTFKNSMEVLQHVAKEHSKDIIPNISVKEKEQQIDQHYEDISENKDIINILTQFKCFKCKEIVSLTDKFNDDLQEEQMCKLCTMTEAYG